MASLHVQDEPCAKERARRQHYANQKPADADKNGRCCDGQKGHHVRRCRACGRLAGNRVAGVNKVPNSRVSPATRRRVLTAAEALNYRRGKIFPAQQGVRRIVGLFLDELGTTPFAARLIEGARDEAALHDITLAVFCTGNIAALEQAALDFLRLQNPLGIIYATLITRQIKVPPHFAGLPLVLLNCTERKGRYSAIIPADVDAAETATLTLLAQGHTRLAHLAGEVTIQAARDREQGFRNVLKSQQIPVDEGLVLPGGWSIRSAREQALALLILPDPPTAIFCFNDRMALGCYEAAHRLGRAIPGDLSIIGFDNEEISASMDPPLTTLVLPHDEMARLAIGQLLDEQGKFEAFSMSDNIEVGWQLIERASVLSRRPQRAGPANLLI